MQRSGQNRGGTAVLPVLQTWAGLAVAAALLSACNIGSMAVKGSGKIITEQRTVSGYSAVDLSNAGKLIIEQNGNEALSIEGDDNLIPLIETTVKDGVLTIKVQNQKSIQPSQQIIYRLSVKTLNAVAISGAFEIESQALQAESFTLDLSGSQQLNWGDLLVTGEVKIKSSGSTQLTIKNLQAKGLQVDATGNGTFTLAGQVESQRVDSSGDNTYEAADLKSAVAVVVISGSANVSIAASQTLDIDSSGSGDITYSGDAKVTRNVSGSGSITKR